MVWPLLNSHFTFCSMHSKLSVATQMRFLSSANALATFSATFSLSFKIHPQWQVLACDKYACVPLVPVHTFPTAIFPELNLCLSYFLI